MPLSRRARTRGSRAGFPRRPTHARSARRHGPQPAAARSLAGIGIGIDEHDGETAVAPPPPAACAACSHNGRRIQRAAGSCRRPASARRPRRAGHDQRWATKSPHRPQVLPTVAAAHLQHIAEARRGDDADARALALQQRVGADRRAMDDGPASARQRRRSSSGPSRKPTASSPRLDGTLADAEASRTPRPGPEQVGEGAADIDADNGLSRHDWLTCSIMCP